MTGIGRSHRAVGWIVVGMLAAGLWAGNGCYTMLRHPSASDGFAATQDASCARCHDAEAGSTLDGTSWVDYYAYSSSPWLNYYASPWWYDNEWYHAPHHVLGPGGPAGGGTGASGGEGGEDTAASNQGRLSWGRRLMADEPSPHDQMDRTTGSSAPIISAPISPPASTSGSTVTVTRDSSSGNPDAAPEKKEEKKGKKGRAIRR